MRQVTAAVIIENGRLLIARRAEGDVLAGLWEMPGGKVEPGESAPESLARELIEELDLVADVAELLATTTYYYSHGSFEMLALRTTRRSEFTLIVHDASAWVSRRDIQNFKLAPADQELVAQLIAAGHW